MKFFPNRLLTVYCKGGKLKMDRKTGVRSWRLHLAIQVTPDDAHASGGDILSNFEHIEARENAAEEIKIGGSYYSVKVQTLPKVDSPIILNLSECVVEDFTMTHSDGITELWVHLEHKVTDKLHAFVKDYAFTSFYVAFEHAQRSFGDALATAGAEGPQKLADEDNTQITLTDHAGKKLREFKPKSRPN